CRQLKADPQLHGIPIIFLSALDEALDKAKAFEVGGADYITKPFQVEEVLARVQHQLTIRQLKQQVADQQQQLARLVKEKAAVPRSDMKVIDSSVVSAIATILDYSDRLSRNPAIDPEHYAGLKVIQQNGQTLLKFMNSLT
ncbi:MAG TPA: hybrid sensor histidine kinase/response regulator, partial [Microcoleaceae cyanobacterium]